MLFPQASSAPLLPCLQSDHSVAPFAKVSPLAMASGLPIVSAAQWYFSTWLVARLVCGLFGIGFPLPFNILVVGGCYSLASLQSSLLTLFSSCFFISLFQHFSLLLLLLFFISLFYIYILYLYLVSLLLFFISLF